MVLITFTTPRLFISFNVEHSLFFVTRQRFLIVTVTIFAVTIDRIHFKTGLFYGFEKKHFFVKL